MGLTDEQRAVLAHVVIDPDEWIAHAVDSLGEEEARQALEAKVTRWRLDWLAKKDAPGYKTRAEREM